VIPFILDGTYLISRFIGALLITAGLTLSFVLLRRRRPLAQQRLHRGPYRPLPQPPPRLNSAPIHALRDEGLEALA
jgi:hypothetical protein